MEYNGNQRVIADVACRYQDMEVLILVGLGCRIFSRRKRLAKKVDKNNDNLPLDILTIIKRNEAAGKVANWV